MVKAREASIRKLPIKLLDSCFFLRGGLNPHFSGTRPSEVLMLVLQNLYSFTFVETKLYQAVSASLGSY